MQFLDVAITRLTKSYATTNCCVELYALKSDL